MGNGNERGKPATRTAGKDISIAQIADIKVLVPVLQEALRGGNGGGLNLNMVGPIYIGTDNGSAAAHALPEAAERAILPESGPAVRAERLSFEELFDTDMPLEEFQREAKKRYFRAVAARYGNQVEKLIMVLGVSRGMIYRYAKAAGIEVRDTR